MSGTTHPQPNATLTGAAESEQSTRPATEMLDLGPARMPGLLAATVRRTDRCQRPRMGPPRDPIRQLPLRYTLAIGPDPHRGGVEAARRVRSATAAFEIDGIDPDGRVGWSVIILGVGEEITDPAELQRIAAPGLSRGRRGRSPLDPDPSNVVSGRRIAPVSEPTMTTDASLAQELCLRNGLRSRSEPSRPMTKRRSSSSSPACAKALGVCGSSPVQRTCAARLAAELPVMTQSTMALVALAPGRGVVGHAIYVRVPDCGQSGGCRRGRRRPAPPRPGNASHDPIGAVRRGASDPALLRRGTTREPRHARRLPQRVRSREHRRPRRNRRRVPDRELAHRPRPL